MSIFILLGGSIIHLIPAYGSWPVVRHEETRGAPDRHGAHLQEVRAP